MIGGVYSIALERDKQFNLGFTYARDDQYVGNELLHAAMAYVVYNINPNGANEYWPSSWSNTYWNPSKDKKKNLAKAGALIAAEIDRLERVVKKIRLNGFNPNMDCY